MIKDKDVVFYIENGELYVNGFRLHREDVYGWSWDPCDPSILDYSNGVEDRQQKPVSDLRLGLRIFLDVTTVEFYNSLIEEGEEFPIVDHWRGGPKFSGRWEYNAKQFYDWLWPMQVV